MCHHSSQRVREADVPGRLQFRRPFIEHVGVTTRPLGGQESHAEDLAATGAPIRARCAPPGKWATRRGRSPGSSSRRSTLRRARRSAWRSPQRGPARSRKLRHRYRQRQPLVDCYQGRFAPRRGTQVPAKAYLTTGMFSRNESRDEASNAPIFSARELVPQGFAGNPQSISG